MKICGRCDQSIQDDGVHRARHALVLGCRHHHLPARLPVQEGADPDHPRRLCATELPPADGAPSGRAGPGPDRIIPAGAFGVR